MRNKNVFVVVAHVLNISHKLMISLYGFLKIVNVKRDIIHFNNQFSAQ